MPRRQDDTHHDRFPYRYMVYKADTAERRLGYDWMVLDTDRMAAVAAFVDHDTAEAFAREFEPQPRAA